MAKRPGLPTSVSLAGLNHIDQPSTIDGFSMSRLLAVSAASTLTS